MPHCLIIAGPNGAGKTTFARTFLPREKILHFVNADLLAAGLSPLNPGAARVAAGRLFLSELDRLAAARKDFAFETTLSGLTYVSRLKSWRRLGYRIEIIYLRLIDAGLLSIVSQTGSAPAAIIFPKRTFAAASCEAGTISRIIIGCWQTMFVCWM